MRKGDERKLKQLMLYISSKRPDISNVKLNKILFYSDFTAYAHRGRPITGVEYRRYEFGPAPVGIKGATIHLDRSGAAYVHPQRLPSGAIKRILLPVEAADLSIFEAEEIAIVDQVMAECLDHTAPELSDMSHEFVGWKLAAQGEEIPYFTVLVDPERQELAEDERAWAAQVAQQVVTFPRET